MSGAHVERTCPERKSKELLPADFDSAVDSAVSAAGSSDNF
jgi:hypothetical protein